MLMESQKRSPRWYFGGLSSAAAVNITHPFDLIKVHLQTQQLPRKSLWQTVLHIYENGDRCLCSGLLGFYQGISASIARQLTATMARFGIYETGKCHIDSSKISHSIALAMSAGFVGGLVGVPNDVVNVRMQNDMKLPPDQQRNYKHVFDGLFRIVQEEGAGKLLTGAPVAIGRGMLLTISQNVVYDTSKSYLLRELQFDDNIGVHFTCSLTSGGCATLATQPLDVVKTRLMNAKAGKYDSYLSVITHIGRTGPVGFFKGFIPAFARIGPHTVLTFLIMEQLRLHFGHPPVNSN
uniref:Mitochondrial dicarboxylate carrier n=1 Tax=Glossina pallidipes TaxID=7398 RepID=A0A1B0AGN5_GLOPL